MPATNQRQDSRISIINAVKTPLGFFVLVVLVVEATLGGLAAKGDNQMVIVSLMVLVILALVAVVTFLAMTGRIENLVGAQESISRTNAFCRQISGYWWEEIKPNETTALSFLEISPNPDTGTVRMVGRAFSKNASLTAKWETVAACVSVSERKVFYYWKGDHPEHPEQPYEGFGEFFMNQALDSGDGMFLDLNLVGSISTRKSVTLARATDGEQRVLREGNGSAIRDVIQSRLRLIEDVRSTTA